MIDKCIKAFLVTVIPGAIVGFVSYTIIEEINALIACLLAGIIAAITIGTFYFEIQRKKK